MVAYLFTHEELLEAYEARFDRLCSQAGRPMKMLCLPRGTEERVESSVLGCIEIACFIGLWEEDPGFTRRFLGSALRAPNLRWMHLPNVGVDHPVFAKLQARGVRLTTSAGASAEPIANTVIAAVLGLARGFPDWWLAKQRREWRPHPVPRRDLRGQTMMVVGLGAIGNEVARLGKSLGLRVIGVRRHPRRAGDYADEILVPEALASRLGETDWLVLACPLTQETRGWIDARRLNALPRGAHVINIARGPVVDETALIDALRSGHLAGAYLDVFETEPLPEGSPLWELPNVILSPHNAASSAGHSGRVAEIFFENLERWLAGSPLRNEVEA